MTEIGSLIVATVAAITAILAAIANRRQAKEEAALAVSRASVNLIQPLNKRIDRLESEIREKDKRIRQLEKSDKEKDKKIEQLLSLMAQGDDWKI